MPITLEKPALLLVEGKDEVNFFNANATLTSIQSLLSKHHQPVPNNLCLDTVKNHPVLLCVDHYLSCLEEKLESDYFPRNRAKARMHAFLAGQNKLVPSLGLAAKKGYFNLRAEVLSDLRRFLEKLKKT
jgi:hypothetical protein